MAQRAPAAPLGWRRSAQRKGGVAAAAACRASVAQRSLPSFPYASSFEVMPTAIRTATARRPHGVRTAPARRPHGVRTASARRRHGARWGDQAPTRNIWSADQPVTAVPGLVTVTVCRRRLPDRDHLVMVSNRTRHGLDFGPKSRLGTWALLRRPLGRFAGCSGVLSCVGVQLLRMLQTSHVFFRGVFCGQTT